MAGLAWTVQIVQYPGFARVGPADFAGFHGAHATGIGRLLALPWGVEVAAAAALVIAAPAGVAPALAWIGLALAAGLVAVTGLVFAPLHRRLGAGYDPAIGRRLVALSWIRTAAWSLRGLIAALLLWSAAT